MAEQADAVLFLRCHSGEEKGEECTWEEVAPDGLVPRRPTLEELAVSSISELICPLCKQVFSIAVTAACGDVFCRDCLREETQANDAACPICEQPLEAGTPAPSRAAQKRLATLQMRCENGLSYDLRKRRFTAEGFLAEGCPVVVAYSDYHAHLQKCSYTIVACAYQDMGCSMAVERAAWKAHCAACNYRMELCECGQDVVQLAKEEHRKVCRARSMPCPHSQFGCVFVGTLAAAEEHLKICPYEMVKMALYKPVVQKVYEECLAAAKCEAENVQWNHRGESDELRRQLMDVKEGIVLKFDDQTKNVPEELRVDMKDKLQNALDVLDLSLSSPTSSSPLPRSVPTTNSSPSRGSPGRSLPEESIYSFEEVVVFTDNFSKANLLGKGGFGAVYKGMLYGTPVAVKRLHEGGNVSEFEFEVSVLRRIRHPHIVMLIGCNPESMCIVSEFLAGGSLDDRLKGAACFPPLGWVDRLRICAEMASALLYLHRNGILHRDLKPANVLLDQNNSCKLVDMGLAKLFQDTTTIMSQPKGTFGYIDPFQLQTGQLSRSSDVYALGLIILQLLTGHRRIQAVHQVLEACGPAAPRRDLEVASEVFLQRLDPSAGRWGHDQARAVLRVALQCVERSKGARPDLQAEVQPALFHAAEGAKAAAALLQGRAKAAMPRGDGFSGRGQADEVQPLQGLAHRAGGRKLAKTQSDGAAAAVERNEVPNSTRWASPMKTEHTAQKHSRSGPQQLYSSSDSRPIPCYDASLSLSSSTASGSFSSDLAQAPPPNEAWISNRERTAKAGSSELDDEGEQQSPDAVAVLEEVQVLRKHARKQHARREHLKALDTFALALDRLPAGHPMRADLHSCRAECVLDVAPLQYSGAAVEVVKECTQALAAAPPHAWALICRAHAYEALGNWRLAEMDLDTLLRIDPNNSRALELRRTLQAERLRATNSAQLPSSMLDDADSLAVSDIGGVHFGDTCQGCGVTPICGLLFRSFRRRDFQLCRSCRLKWSSKSEEFEEVAPPENSNALFLYSLGYGHGACIIRNKRDTIRLLQKASQRGHPLAKTALGHAYRQGDGVDQDDNAAAKWLSLGATMPDEQYELGRLYKEGKTVSKDLQEAVRLLSLAAVQGHAGARMELAQCYAEGRGVAPDSEEAARLFRLAAVAAEADHMKAQLKLGTSVAGKK